MKSDIEISRETELLNIEEIAEKLGISSYIEPYGKYKAKIDLSVLNDFKGKKDGHLVLVTSMNPTPLGEGKTTMTIGISDALCDLGYSSIAALREPSLGPVFGIKGGATGGGYSQVVPMEEINLHFTGDMHAITSCNNLLCAEIDNMLFQGNELNLDPKTIAFTRCMDMNDRALRKITVGSGKGCVERSDSFQITVASEIMAILCLSTGLMDLKRRLGNIFIGYTYDGKPLYAKDFHSEGAMTILLKDALKPNLVQTLEHHPAIIHGGPFANIAHGCNSVLATKMALKLGDYVITEAGFGADLGGEKFLDIKCRKAGLKPDVIVVNATIRSLKLNGGCPKEELTLPNLSYLKKGVSNLEVHVENMKKYSNHVIICLNHFETDVEEEITWLKDFANRLGVFFEVSKSFKEGGKGATLLAQKIVELCKEESTFEFLYQDELSLREKIEVVAKEIYRATSVNYQENVLEKIEKMEAMGYKHFPVCIAKTQYSLSDDAKKVGEVGTYEVTVRDVKISSGAEFVVVLLGSIMTMPGLSKKPALLSMDIDENGIITGLF